MIEKCVLGIDTSNYKTSVALVCGRDVTADVKSLLKVREGQRGLRQSEALFQHVQNLPVLLRQIRESFQGTVDGVAYSTRPRPVEGSYMPCFNAGVSQAVSIASALDVPAIGFSHQEGHIEAALSSCGERPEGDFIACHFSGGTCEVLKIKQRGHLPCNCTSFEELSGERAFYDIELIGGTKDISYGQVLDRAGVAMGLSFPCGEALDGMALSAVQGTSVLTRIKADDAQIHLSGFDTQLRNRLAETVKNGDPADPLIREAFEKISDSIILMLRQSRDRTGISIVYMSGGVSSSRFIRQQITEKLCAEGIRVVFAEADMSADNAVGTAILGSRYLWG